jgi:hypothetical protein
MGWTSVLLLDPKDCNAFDWRIAWRARERGRSRPLWLSGIAPNTTTVFKTSEPWRRHTVATPEPLRSVRRFVRPAQRKTMSGQGSWEER